MKCKAQKGYPCNYLEFGAWCKYCGFMDYSDEDLRSLDDFSSAHIKSTQQLHVQLIGPDNTPYNRKYYQLIINIPDDYPQKVPTFYFGSEVYHVNVDRESNRILYNKITSKGWRSYLRLF
jgi:ubiquitin-protein ligase